MDSDRLPAKLARPRLAGVVDRERLFGLLDAERDRSIVWVMGPPGAGKTTLVTTWLVRNGSSTLWYRIDDGDADAATFFSYLSQAAAALEGGGGKRLPLLTPEYLLDVPGFARRYFRALYAALPDGSALVLDGFENAAGGALDGLLGIAAAEALPGMQLLVTSRGAAPEAVGHLVASGGMVVVRWEDLRLSPDEARAIAGTRTAGKDETAESLLAMSGGWAAGFVVMLEHSRRVGAIDAKLPEAVHESLFAYFVNEMFQRIDAPTRELLIRTAILSAFTVPQAASLFPLADAQAILLWLYRQHFFTDRTAGAEPEYRYHALFRDFLLEQGRMSISAPERNQLLVAAATLAHASGRSEEAVALLTEAGACQEAGRLICELAPTLLRQGRMAVLDRAIGLLPGQVLADMPWLSYWLGIARMLFAPPAGRALLQSAFARFEEKGDASAALITCSGILDSFSIEWHDMHPVDRWGAVFHSLARRVGALEVPADGQLIAASPASLVSPVAASLASLLFRSDLHAPLLEEGCRWALSVVARSTDATERVAAANFVGFQLAAQGEMAQLRKLVTDVDAALEANDVPPIQFMIWLMIKSWSVHQSGAAQAASGLVRQVETMAETSGIHILDVLIAGQGVYPALIAGDVELAEAYAHKTSARLHPSRVLDSANFDWMRASVALARGDAKRALEFGAACLEKTIVCGANLSTAQCRTVLAYALLDQGDVTRVFTEVNHILAYAMPARHRAFEHAALMIQAGALARSGAADAAQTVLRRALAMGRELGVVVIFPWSPTPFLQSVYGLALDAGIEVPHVQSIIGRLNIPAPETAGDLWPRPVKIFTLGRFEILLDDAPLVFSRKSPKRPLALLKFLVAHRGRASAEMAIDALWPDEEADAAASSLDAALHRLRRLLGGASRVELQDGQLSLDRKSIWADLFAFERVLDAAESNGEEVNPLLSRALAGYRGHFLTDDRAEPWTISTRERLRSRFMRAAAAHGRALEAARNFDVAAEHYARAIDVDELIEGSYQGLMRCQAALGLRSEGVATYQRLRQSLRAGLGLEPSQASELLQRELRGS